MEEVKVNNESVYLKKDLIGWHIVHPIKVDGKINWKNLISGGSWWKLGAVILFVIIALGAMNEYLTALKLANKCLEQLPGWVQISI